MEAVKSASLGQISGALYAVGGEYRAQHVNRAIDAPNRLPRAEHHRARLRPRARRPACRPHRLLHPPVGDSSQITKVGGTKDVRLERVRKLKPTHAIVNVDENRGRRS